MTKIFPVALCILLSQPVFSQDTRKADSTIVFVCEHGAARSTIAAAYFNKLAREQGLKYRAVFRGTNPDSAIGAATKKGLELDGFKVAGWKPKAATKEDLENAARVVSLDCIIPQTHTPSKPVVQWTGIPLISVNYNAGRDTILKKVQALVAELSLKKSTIQ